MKLCIYVLQYKFHNINLETEHNSIDSENIRMEGNRFSKKKQPDLDMIFLRYEINDHTDNGWFYRISVVIVTSID